MRKIIRKLLENESRLLEFGMSNATLRRYMPKNYLLKNKKTVDDRLKKSLRIKSEKINQLYLEVVTDLKNLQWQDIEFYVENQKGVNFFFLLLPKELKNKIKKINDYYITLEENNYLNFLISKEKIKKLHMDYVRFISSDYIYMYVDEPRNRTHFPKGLPKSFLGYGLAEKMYRKMIYLLGFIQSDDIAKPAVQNFLINLKGRSDLNVIAYLNSIILIDESLSLDTKIEILSESIYETYRLGSKRKKISLETGDILLDSKLKKQIGVDRINRIIDDIYYNMSNLTHEPFEHINTPRY